LNTAKEVNFITTKDKLKKLKLWKKQGKKLTRTIKFHNFMDGLYFVTSVAKEAEKLGHHPDVLLKYGEVTFTLTTHDKDALTEKDITLAECIDKLYGKP
jgi:4a-hydroxytetrahydrobiopterin dehydratase